MRRVVTGHDSDGRAIVLNDGLLELQPGRSDVTSRVLWTTESFPVDNGGNDDAGNREVGISLPNGTVFRIVEFHPGNAAMPHRTETIDYAVVMSGEIDMELDDDVIHFCEGDVLVQRGTMHNWINRGDQPCRIAFVLIDASVVVARGEVLTEQGVYSYPPPGAAAGSDGHDR